MATTRRESQTQQYGEGEQRMQNRETELSRREQDYPPSPFGLMRRLSDEMDRMFGNFFVPFEGTFFGPSRTQRFRGSGSFMPQWAPPVEVFERDNKMVVVAELPGMSKNDVHVDVVDDVLTITGERHDAQEESGQGFRHSERRYGRFMRQIPLPEGTDPDQVRANFKNGLLEITLPMLRKEHRTRQVSIQEEPSR